MRLRTGTHHRHFTGAAGGTQYSAVAWLCTKSAAGTETRRAMVRYRHGRCRSRLRYFVTSLLPRHAAACAVCYMPFVAAAKRLFTDSQSMIPIQAST